MGSFYLDVGYKPRDVRPYCHSTPSIIVARAPVGLLIRRHRHRRRRRRRRRQRRYSRVHAVILLLLLALSPV